MSAARDDVTVYWGVASGRSHATFRRHYEGEPAYMGAPEPSHLMVSWRSAVNQVWAGPTWMIDSGGAPQTIIPSGGHPDSIEDYIDYLRNPPTRYGDDIDDVSIEKFALRDWPCEPSVRQALGLSVEELQYRTLIDHINMMDRIEDEPIDAKPVAVLQGWEVEDYLTCIDLFRDHGLITDEIAIGTLCGRANTDVIRNTAWRIARNLPGRCKIHGFGVKTAALGEPDVLRIFDSVDTAAWDIILRQATKDGIERGPPGGDYGDWIEWDDRGNPRMTARNAWEVYRAYAQRLGAIQAVETPKNTRVVTLDQLFEFVDEPAPPGQRIDEYLIAECPAGGFIDPGRPDPQYGPTDRFCERAELNIRMQRIDLEDQLQVGGIDAAFGRGGFPDRPVSDLRPFVDAIRERMDE